MYLIDTNIWLELLLQQEKAEEVSSFFQAVDSSSLAITDFTLYSIGIILTRLKKFDAFNDFSLWGQVCLSAFHDLISQLIDPCAQHLISRRILLKPPPGPPQRRYVTAEKLA